MNQASLLSEDPKLTAYALGELEGDERAALEARLRDDPAAQAAVAEIRAVAVRLEAVLAAEPVVAANGTPKAATPAQQPRAAARRFSQLFYLGGGLAAAGVAAMIALRTPRPMTEVTPMTKPAIKQKASVEKNAAAVVPAGETATPGATPEPGRSMVEATPNAPGLLADGKQARGEAKPTVMFAVPDEAAASPVPADFPPWFDHRTKADVSQEKAGFAQGDPRTAAKPTVAGAALSAPLAVYSGDKAPPSGDRNSRSGSDRVTPPPAPEREGTVAKDEAGEVIVLSPFKVEAAQDTGFRVSNSLAGSRGKASLSAIGSVSRDVRRSRQPVPAGRPQAFGVVGGAAGAAMTWGTRRPAGDTEAYAYRPENGFLSARENPLSTFSADVDTASYANVRRFIEAGQRPPVDAVRIEELVNYFPYRYAPPRADGGRVPSPAEVDQRGEGTAPPFAATMEVAEAPWASMHRLVRIGLKGREVAMAERGAANLVFLLDVSGSMNQPNKLPLVKESLHLLLGRLRADDRVAIVTYAGASGLALPSTAAAKAHEIAAALDELQPEGSTNGAMGIQLAYDIAKANFVNGGINRVILCTDGDFNVGVTSEGELVRLIQAKAKSGVFLTVLGFGMGNYKDATLPQLADAGNGNYGYIDTRREAEKLLVEQVSGTLVTIAKDVKLQVEFNPAKVASYRLIGYEKRLLKKEDFNNDKVDAGEIGSGHTVTALYEIIPAGATEGTGAVDPLKYAPAAAAEAPRTKLQAPENEGKIPNAQSQTPKSEAGTRNAELGTVAATELLTLKVRYKEPAGEVSRKLEFPLVDGGARFAQASDDFKFAAAVAAFAMVLRESPERGTATLAEVAQWAEAGASADPGGYRAEFAALVKKAQQLP